MGDEDYRSVDRLGGLSVSAQDGNWVRSHIRHFPLPTQVGHQCPRVIVEILPAYSISSMGVRIVAPAEDAGLWEVVGEEVSEPVDTVFRRPCLLPVAVEAMQCNDAAVVRQGRSRDVDGTYSTIRLSPSETTSRPCGCSTV